MNTKPFTNKQRVYYLWLRIIQAIQELDNHDGDQGWLTRRKDKLLKITGDNGRKYNKDMSVDKMAMDILAMVTEEARGLIRSALNRKAS